MQLESRPCPLCGSADDSRVFVEADWDPSRLDRFAFASRKRPDSMHHRMVECRSCDLLYASPAPPVSVLARAYETSAFDTTMLARYASRTYASLIPWKTLPNDGGALDVGTGDGAFLEELLRAGMTDVVGVEASREAVEAASEGIRHRILHGSFEASKIEKERFRIVTCFQTLEHLGDPLSFCRDAKRLLRPGGALLVACHNRRALSARMLGTRSPIFDIEHLQLFSRASVQRLLRRAGFANVAVWSYTNRYPLHYWARLLPLPARAKNILLRLIARSGLENVPVILAAGNLAAIGYKV